MGANSKYHFLKIKGKQRWRFPRNLCDITVEPRYFEPEKSSKRELGGVWEGLGIRNDPGSSN